MGRPTGCAGLGENVAALSRADLLLVGGRIHCGRGLPMADALAVSGRRILATGRADALANLAGPDTRIFDLAGRFACAGLIDSHLHLLPLGLTLGEVDARPSCIGSIAELVAALRARAATLPPGHWIVARGYDDNQLAERRHPTRDDLDLAAPGHPIYLGRSCGHVAVVNSAALALAGLDEATVAPPGGRIESTDGRLTGRLDDTARTLVRKVLPPSSDADLVDAIERAGRLCLSRGITSVMDAAVGARAGHREILAYRAARASGRLPLRAHLALVGGDGGIMEAAIEEGLRTGHGDRMLAIGPAKLFADGSAGARTAAMAEGYSGEPDNHGILYLPDARLRELVRRYHDAGFQMAVHAVGELAIEQVLDAYEMALAGRAEPGRRHRIEHATFTTAGQIARMARLGVEPVPQPVFLHDYGSMYLANVGATRTAAAFPMRSWMTAGLRPAASTDSPISRIDPLPNLVAMRERRTARGVLVGADQTVTPTDALAAYTEWGAFANRAEGRVGRLAPGLMADIAVFSCDLIDGDVASVRSGRCEATFLGGELVYATDRG